MRFKFGTYSVKIKSYTSRELGIQTEYPNLNFTIRQKVFHFWFIPLFPVDKFWEVSQLDTGEKVLETTPKMRHAIDLKMVKAKSPFWSFSGVIIVVIPIIVLLGYFLYGAIDTGINDVNKTIAKANRIEEKEKLVKGVKIEDVYTFKTLNVEKITDNNGHFVNYKPSYFSSPYEVDFIVNYISKDSVGFEYIKKSKTSDYTYGLKKEFKLSKTDMILAAKGYQDLDIQKYANKDGANTKNITGIFKIKRD